MLMHDAPGLDCTGGVGWMVVGGVIVSMDYIIAIMLLSTHTHSLTGCAFESTCRIASLYYAAHSSSASIDLHLVYAGMDGGGVQKAHTSANMQYV